MLSLTSKSTVLRSLSEVSQEGKLTRFGNGVVRLQSRSDYWLEPDVQHPSRKTTIFDLSTVRSPSPSIG